MKSKLFGLMALAPLGVALSVGAANASTVTFDWTESDYSGSGTLTATYVSGDEYLITAITGTFYGDQIVGLISPGGFLSNDNELFYSAAIQLDNDGLSFQTTTNTYNIAYDDSTAAYIVSFPVSSPPVCCDVDPGDSFSVAATPLPGALPLFCAGLCLVGMLATRRKRNLLAFA